MTTSESPSFLRQRWHLAFRCMSFHSLARGEGRILPALPPNPFNRAITCTPVKLPADVRYIPTRGVLSSPRSKGFDLPIIPQPCSRGFPLRCVGWCSLSLWPTDSSHSCTVPYGECFILLAFTGYVTVFLRRIRYMTYRTICHCQTLTDWIKKFTGCDATDREPHFRRSRCQVVH